MSNWRRELKAKKEVERLKIPIIVQVLIIFSCIIVILIVANDIITSLSDAQEEAFVRKYQLTTFDNMGIKEIKNDDGTTTQEYFMDGVQHHILLLEGTIKLETPSGSEKYPISAKIKLDAKFKEEGFFSTSFEDLPDKLHLEFIGAKNRDGNKESPNAVVVIEKRINIKPYYFGEEKIIYDEEGEYDFFVRESKGQEENLVFEQNPNGTSHMEIFLPVSNDTHNSGFRIFELSQSENKKIKIDPYSQTIQIETYKVAWYSGMMAVIATTGYKLSKNIMKLRQLSNKS